MQLFWCSHCGGSLPSKDALACPHCGVGLRGVYEGDSQAYQVAQKRFAKWRREQFRKKLSIVLAWTYRILKRILKYCLLIVCVLAVLAIYSAATYGLYRGLLFVGQHLRTSSLGARTVICTITVELTALVSLILYKIYEPNWLNWLWLPFLSDDHFLAHISSSSLTATEAMADHLDYLDEMADHLDEMEAMKNLKAAVDAGLLPLKDIEARRKNISIPLFSRKRKVKKVIDYTTLVMY